MSSQHSSTAKQKRCIKRYIVKADNHDLIGRIYDLAMPLQYGFQSFAQLKTYPDCLYVFNAGQSMGALVQRVESLNFVGDMLWTKKFPRDFSQFPISRYDWLKVVSDVFLMRYISIMDCCLLLTNDIFECNLPPQKCRIDLLEKSGVPKRAITTLTTLLSKQDAHRNERNLRFHRGYERSFTKEDLVFHLASTFEKDGRSLSGDDREGNPINVQRYFREAINDLRIEFNTSVRTLSKNLTKFYDVIHDDFEQRFSSKFHARSTPLPW